MLLSVTVPAGIKLDTGKSRVRIDTVPGEGEEAALALEFPVSKSIAELALRLPAGLYTVDVLLVAADGKSYAETLEVAIVLPDADAQDIPAVPDLKFTPDVEAFMTDKERENLTATVQIKAASDNGCGLTIVQAGGGGAARTRSMKAFYGLEQAYFVVIKKESQTLTSASPLVNLADAPVGGETPGAGKEVVLVDISGIKGGGSMTFALTVSEPGKNAIVYTFTIEVPRLVSFGVMFDWLMVSDTDHFQYKKLTYLVGEEFDRKNSFMVVGATYADGSSRTETVYEVEGFDNTKPGSCLVRFHKGDIYATIDSHYDSVVINVIEPSPARLFFDYGRVISADGAPGRYTVTAGNKLVIAPVLWHIPEGAALSWDVSGGVYETNGEFLTFKPGTPVGNYTATVTASFSGGQVSASTSVECVAPDGPASPSTVSGMSNLALSAGDHHGWNTSLGGYGGYLIKKMQVINNSGYDFCINGNAFGNWAEPGIVWVMKDENHNGEADDTWYELTGNAESWGVISRRYAVTYHKPAIWQQNRILSSPWYEDSAGGWNSYGGWGQTLGAEITFAGTYIGRDWKGHFGNEFRGYVDVLDNRFDIATAIHADGSPKEFDSIDFIRVQSAQNHHSALFGEISTEITSGASGITLLWDSSRQLSGTAVSGGYAYVVANSSGYQLTLSFKDVSTSYVVNDGETKNITLSASPAFFNYVGGNVKFAISGNKVTFTAN
jgi:hypothetical protein